jgi:branched-chain amino acid transport system permease protein
MQAMTTSLKSSPQAVVTVTVLMLLALLPAVAYLMGEMFYVDLGTRILIFSIAAVSLDLILGYGGMISLGHAAYIGIGSYSVGILSFYGIDNGIVHFGVAAGASALIALFIGAGSVRTVGIHFIMISLAFGQMLYYLAISVNKFGGDDGLTIKLHSNFGAWLNLGDPITLYYVCLAALLIVLVVLHRLVGSRFGMVVRGIKSNEARMTAIGISSFRYKLLAFVISATICGIAGALLANQNLFISPASMHWTRSGEILIMTILGGMGSLSGAVLGAMMYVSLEYFLSRLTEHWQLILGFVIVVVVLLAGRGLFGLFVGRRQMAG